MDSRDPNLPHSKKSSDRSKGKGKIGGSNTTQDQHQNHDSQRSLPLIPYEVSNSITSNETYTRVIAQFFYENNVSPCAVASRSFRKLLELGGNGAVVQESIPTIKDLRERILHKEVQQIEKHHVQEMKKSWPSTGCSVILDGWDDEKGRKLINILVDCPKGVVYLRSIEITPSLEDFDQMVEVFEGVINEVGKGNVAQVISYTSSTPWLAAVGNWIKESHKSVFWSTSATHSLSLILERVASSINWVKETIAQAKRVTRLVYSNKSLLTFMARTDARNDYGHVLVVPSKIRAAIPFLTLEKMLLRKDDLEALFASQEWMECGLRLSPRGRDVLALVGDKSFWQKVTLVVKGAIPIVKVLSLFFNGESDDNIPQMGIIYETMDQMKETIENEIGKRKAQEFWGIIDEIWNKILHSPLHAAGYYLNPRIYYTQDFATDSEVTEGMLSTVLRIGGDQETQGLITEQLKNYEHGLGYFRQGILERNCFPPVEWWKKFGRNCPELQNLAIKVLGLTCNGASTYELRRDVAEQMFSVKESHPLRKWLNNLAFVSYNINLRQVKQPGFKFDIFTHEIDEFNDWMVGQY